MDLLGFEHQVRFHYDPFIVKFNISTSLTSQVHDRRGLFLPFFVRCFNIYIFKRMSTCKAARQHEVATIPKIENGLESRFCI
jgi:hypothetical protein